MSEAEERSAKQKALSIVEDCIRRLIDEVGEEALSVLISSKLGVYGAVAQPFIPQLLSAFDKNVLDKLDGEVDVE